MGRNPQTLMCPNYMPMCFNNGPWQYEESIAELYFTLLRPLVMDTGLEVLYGEALLADHPRKICFIKNSSQKKKEGHQGTAR